MENNPIDVDESDDEDLIEEEQLDEYREMVENLGTFPVSVAFDMIPPTISSDGELSASIQNSLPVGQSKDQQFIHGGRRSRRFQKECCGNL